MKKMLGVAAVLFTLAQAAGLVWLVSEAFHGSAHATQPQPKMEAWKLIHKEGGGLDNRFTLYRTYDEETGVACYVATPASEWQVLSCVKVGP